MNQHHYVMPIESTGVSPGLLFTSASRAAGACALALFLLLSTALGSGVVHAEEAREASPHVSVNINKADADALADGLAGVGLSRAREIVRYRETYGPFATVEELTEVKGVGKSTIDKNRAVITLE